MSKNSSNCVAQLLAVAFIAVVSPHTFAATPGIVNYQGRVQVNGQDFTGNGQFKFAFVNGAGTVTFWGNDGTSTTGNEPASAVTLTVNKALYSVLLGDTSLTNMTAIPATVFTNTDVRLRIWFNDGTNGSQQLFPDQKIAAVGYAMVANSADSITGVVPIANGGTGSAVQNFVDTLTNQSVGGNKSFTGAVSVSTAFVVEARPNNTQVNNLFVGSNAGAANTSGMNNAFFGLNAGANSNANSNSFFGIGAGAVNTSGAGNSFFGADAGTANTTGQLNSFFGEGAGGFTTTGSRNSFFGLQAGLSNTTANDNSFFGYFAGQSSTGVNNSFFGSSAGAANTSGTNNSFFGQSAEAANTIAQNNAFFGYGAGASSTTGGVNCFFGSLAGQENTTGVANAFFGTSAGLINTGSNNTFLGFTAGNANTTGTSNTAIGVSAGTNLTTGSNNIDIGHPGVAAESNTIRIGIQGTQTQTFIAGISGATASGGAAVFVNSNGQFGTVTSSKRFKDNIQTMDKASEAVLALRPVTFQYKKELDPRALPQFGLVAEEVNAVNPDLVVRDEKGEIYTVRYEAVNAMLLNEFLKEHRKNEALQKRVETLEQRLDALAAQVRKAAEH